MINNHKSMVNNHKSKAIILEYFPRPPMKWAELSYWLKYFQLGIIPVDDRSPIADIAQFFSGKQRSIYLTIS